MSYNKPHVPSNLAMSLTVQIIIAHTPYRAYQYTLAAFLHS